MNKDFIIDCIDIID